MTIRFVTTCHKQGWEQYGKQCLAGWKHMPKDAELFWYTENFDLPATPRVRAIDNATLPGLKRFKERYRHYIPPYYLWDVVRFSNKIFAVIDALEGFDGIGVWMDADIVPFADVPEGYIESLLPEGVYLALFKRSGMYSECGFWIVDCRHEKHREFLSRVRQWYDDDSFRNLAEWHDCYLMDITWRSMERDGLIKTASLSGEFAGEEHPMARVELARYLDHLKGPSRKHAGRSPENENRAAA